MLTQIFVWSGIRLTKLRLTFPYMAFFSTNPSSVTTSTSTAGDKDIEVTEPPPDSISSLSFSTQADYLAVGSWDNSVCSLP